MSEHTCETCAYGGAYCDYLSVTGHVRGCPSGPECTRYVDCNSPEGEKILNRKAAAASQIYADPDSAQGCTKIGKINWDVQKARQLWDDGYKISEIEAAVEAPKDEVRRYINLHPSKFPKGERERNLKTRQASVAPAEVPTPSSPERKRPGPKLTWDVQTAIALYADGKSFKEIAPAVGAKYQSVVNYANRHRDQFPIELQTPPKGEARRSEPHTHTHSTKGKTGLSAAPDGSGVTPKPDPVLAALDKAEEAVRQAGRQIRKARKLLDKGA